MTISGATPTTWSSLFVQRGVTALVGESPKRLKELGWLVGVAERIPAFKTGGAA